MLVSALTRRAMHSLRAAVVATSNWPILSSAYRSAYELQTHRISRALRDIPGVRAVLLRGSTGKRVHAGLSDIDLVVLMDEEASPKVLFSACRQVYRRVRRVNRAAPLIRDVHVFTPRELTLLARAGSGLFWGIVYDSVAVVGQPDIPSISLPKSVAREALVREMWFWHFRTLCHLMDDGNVGRGLAARAFAKATSAERQLETSEGSLQSLWLAYARGARDRVSVEQALEMMPRLDAALPAAPPCSDSAPPSPHPVLGAIRQDVYRWAQPLARLPAVSAGLLSIEGAREHDARLYLVIDPAHEYASEALRRIGKHVRAHRFAQASYFSRYPRPLIVTPRQLERTVLARWTAAEPIARIRHGMTLWGSTAAPRATTAEMARSLVLDALGSIVRLRARAADRPTARGAVQIRDAIFGVFPTLEAFADHRPLPTRYSPPSPWLERDPRLRRSGSMHAVFERVDQIVSGAMPRALAIAAAEEDGS